VVSEATTPEAIRDLARLKLKDLDIDGAEKLLRECLLVVPNDGDALVAVAEIQVRRGDPKAVTTFIQAAHMYLQRERARDALDVLDSARAMGGVDSGLAAMRGDALRLDGQLEAAVEEYNRALEEQPGDPWILGGRGAALGEIGRLREAQLDLDRAARLAPTSPHLKVAAAEIALQLQDARGARKYALAATTVEPSLPEAYTVLAAAESRTGALDVALHAARTALRLRPPGPDLLRLAASLERAVGSPAVAVDLLRQLVDQPEATPEDQLKLVEVLVNEQRWDEAIEFARAAAERWPDTAVVHTCYGQLLLRAGHPESAAEVLRIAAAEHPGDAATHLQLGLSLAAIGDHGAAVASLAVGLDIDPDSSDMWAAQAEILAQAGQLPEAVEAARKTLGIDPENLETLLFLARETNDLGEARTLVFQALERHPGDRRLRLMGAWLDVRSGSYEQALQRFGEILEGGPDIDAFVGRTNALRWLGRVDDAVASALEAVAIGDSVKALRSLGLAQLDAGDLTGAVETLARASEKCPADARTAADLGVALAAVDRTDEALIRLDSAVAGSRHDMWPLSQLARLLCHVGHYAGAAKLARRGLESDADDANLWGTLGWALLEADSPDIGTAEAAYAEAVKRRPSDARLLSGLADARHLLGETEKAGADYATALELAQQPDQTLPDPLPVVGWCCFRLGDLPTAAHAFLEALSRDRRPGAEAFDLALVMLCQGRQRRGLATYRDALENLEKRNALLRRGFLAVALNDLRYARADFPELNASSAADEVQELLEAARNALKPLPELAILTQLAAN
jgi:tetratricopeptide (TPR) repeat protein